MEGGASQRVHRLQGHAPHVRHCVVLCLRPAIGTSHGTGANQLLACWHPQSLSHEDQGVVERHRQLDVAKVAGALKGRQPACGAPRGRQQGHGSLEQAAAPQGRANQQKR